MKRTHLYILVAALSAIGFAIFLYKVVAIGLPVASEERTEVWRVEVQLRLKAEGGPVKATLQLPQSTGAFAVIDQSFVSPGFGVTTASQGPNQQAVFSIREGSGAQTLYYRAVVQRSRRFQDTGSRDPQPELRQPQFEGAELEAVRAITQAALRQSADPATLAALIVRRLKETRPGDEAALLLGSQPTTARLVRVAVDLMRFAGVPARVVHGLLLEPERSGAGFVRWIEYYDKGFWAALFPSEPRREALRHYLPWWRGSAPLFTVSGGEAEHHVTISRSQEFSLQVALAQKRELERRLVDYSLFGLPLQSQALFRTVMVIPIGIFLLVVLRNVVGVKTFGTFMPVLIALAFRQTGPLWGIAFLALIIAIGLAIRFYLERLKLLLVPRLAAVVIVVVLTLVVLTIISHRLGIERGLSIGLFPIVIMTMTIERMTLVWEERGPLEAFQQAAGSLVVGTLCYFVMKVALIEHLVFVFPELLLVVLAATLMLGRYSGYRLVELPRFRVLAK